MLVKGAPGYFKKCNIYFNHIFFGIESSHDALQVYGINIYYPETRLLLFFSEFRRQGEFPQRSHYRR